MKRLLLAALLTALVPGTGACAPAPGTTADSRSPKQLLEAFAAELPDERLAAAKAMAAKGPEIVPKLTAALAHKDWRVRRSATDALAELKADAKPAVPALARALEDKDPWVRAGAAAALGRIGADAKAAAPALAKAAAEPDLWVRTCALESLARGTVTDDKELLLRAALGAMAIRESGWAAKRFAMNILNRHGKQHKPAVPVLLRLLEDPPQGMWDGTPKVVEMLVAMGAKDKVVPLLVKMLDPDLRGEPRRAASMLASLGKDAAPALPALRVVAAKAIEQIEAAMKKP